MACCNAAPLKVTESDNLGIILNGNQIQYPTSSSSFLFNGRYIIIITRSWQNLITVQEDGDFANWKGGAVYCSNNPLNRDRSSCIIKGAGNLNILLPCGHAPLKCL
jgi:hypothetical protein